MPPFVDFRSVKERFSVVDALRHYDFLAPMQELDNGQLRGPCPVHSTPHSGGTSFKVTASGLGFRCFGCGAKGNVLDLVAAAEGLKSPHKAALRIEEWLDTGLDTNERRGASAPVSSEGENPAEEPPSDDEASIEEPSAYESHLYAGLPIYSTRLVRETTLDVAHFQQCRTPEALYGLLAPYYREHDREEFVVLLLDVGLHVTGLVSVSIGGLTATVVEPAQVFKPAILGNADSVIVAHNHPSGNAEPSKADVAITRQLVQGGQALGIPVRDHLIVAGSRYTSLAERGLIERPISEAES